MSLHQIAPLQDVTVTQISLQQGTQHPGPSVDMIQHMSGARGMLPAAPEQISFSPDQHCDNGSSQFQLVSSSIVFLRDRPLCHVGAMPHAFPAPTQQEQLAPERRTSAKRLPDWLRTQVEDDLTMVPIAKRHESRVQGGQVFAWTLPALSARGWDDIRDGDFDGGDRSVHNGGLYAWLRARRHQPDDVKLR